MKETNLILQIKLYWLLNKYIKKKNNNNDCYFKMILSNKIDYSPCKITIRDGIKLLSIIWQHHINDITRVGPSLCPYRYRSNSYLPHRLIKKIKKPQWPSLHWNGKQNHTIKRVKFVSWNVYEYCAIHR